MSDRLEAVKDKTVGNVKEFVGDLTNNEKLEAEGKLQQAEGTAHEKVADAKDLAGDAKDRIDDFRNKH